MKSRPKSLRRVSTPLAALALMGILYFLTWQPALPHSEAEDLASRFAFARLPLPELPGYPHKNVREVHPSLRHISAWISSIGAAVAFADLDGDGLPNDVCHVDPRINQVIVAPAPGTPPRYQPFALDPAPLSFEPSTAGLTGCLIGDFNEDGLLDIIAHFWGRTPVVFLHKGGEGNSSILSSAAYVPSELVAGRGRWYTSAAVQGDFDGDGHVDLAFGNYFPDGANILDANATGAESVHDTMAKSFTGGYTHFFLWAGASHGSQPAVKYRHLEGVLDEAVSRGWTLALGAADLDGDLLPEIYISNDFGPDRLLHNRSTPGALHFQLVEGERTSTTPKSCVLGHDSFKGMGVDFADLNGDDVPDIYVSNIAREFGLHESHFLWLSTGDAKARLAQGVAPYRQASEELGLSRSGWGWECRLADFDNDGVPEAMQAVGFIKGTVNRWPELQTLGTANSAILQYPRAWPRFQPPNDDLSGTDINPFFVRARDGRYYNIGARLGMTEPMVSRGIALADIDGDGRLDFALANQWGPSYLYHNTCSAPGAFLGLHVLLALEETAARQARVQPGHPDGRWKGRPAIGATAKVHLPDGRSLTAQVDGGSGHSGERSPDIQFGLGRCDAQAKIRVDLRWRDPAGSVREETLSLQPGWHTVVLARPAGK
ncbi:MAG: CRTAC1 family protein [Gemmataceae bacterium]|nr:CRTAC1 family protein [Gemmataceae bacterium]